MLIVNYTKISQIYRYYTLWVIDGYNMSSTTQVNIALCVDTLLYTIYLYILYLL